MQHLQWLGVQEQVCYSADNICNNPYTSRYFRLVAFMSACYLLDIKGSFNCLTPTIQKMCK